MLNQYKLLKELDFERLSGSKNAAKGREIIKNYLTEMELGYTEEAFELNSFDTGTATIIVDDKEFSAVPYGLTKNTSVKAELAFVENPNELQYNLGAYEGKIVMCFGGTRGIFALLLQNKVKGFIRIAPPYRGPQSLSHRQKQYEDKENIPSCSISYQDGEKLLRLAGKTIELKIKQKTSKRTAYNIVVDLPGKKPDKTLTYVVAHLDSVARSHGSLDNAAGCVNILKTAEYFAKNQANRDMKIIFFSGEELGLLGSQAYVKAHLDEVKTRGRLVVNVDLSGDPIGKNDCVVIGSKNLQGYVAGITKEDGLMFDDYLNIFSSDGMPFCVHEVPVVNIAREGGKGIFYIHTAEDKAKYANPRGLEDTYKACQGLLKRVLNAGIFPVKKDIDSSLREKVEKYMWNLTLTEPKLEWKKKYQK